MTVIHEEFDQVRGVTTRVHDTGDKVVFEKEYDAQPFLNAAAEMRAQTRGQRWGDLRHVGFIPPAELAKMMRQGGGYDKKMAIEWLKKNPALVTFEKALLK